MTCMELYIIYGEIEAYLKEKGIQVVRNWVGTYVTTQGNVRLLHCAVQER